jgi:uncharacterized protein (DUF934 family)
MKPGTFAHKNPLSFEIKAMQLLCASPQDKTPQAQSTQVPSNSPFVGADGLQTLNLSNDIDVIEVDLQGIERIELNFPKFTDGRAFTQAVMLRRRKDFKADIRALGDVLVDQVLQMQRTGFTSAVLREDQSVEVARNTLKRFRSFYQGDALQAQPHFSR